MHALLRLALEEDLLQGVEGGLHALPLLIGQPRSRPPCLVGRKRARGGPHRQSKIAISLPRACPARPCLTRQRELPLGLPTCRGLRIAIAANLDQSPLTPSYLSLPFFPSTQPSFSPVPPPFWKELHPGDSFRIGAHSLIKGCAGALGDMLQLFCTCQPRAFPYPASHKLRIVTMLTIHLKSKSLYNNKLRLGPAYFEAHPLPPKNTTIQPLTPAITKTETTNGQHAAKTHLK